MLVLRGHADTVGTAVFSPDGQSVVTVSADKTVRIWDARAPALGAQVNWVEAAQFDPLPGEDRFQLGLPAASGVRQWPASRSKCDEAAAAPYDPDRRASGTLPEEIVSNIAIAACAIDYNDFTDKSQAVYQHGRALMADGKFSEAARDFERALAGGYRAAAIDLGMLLSQPAGKMLDVPRAISLYERAWSAGVSIAAFELGSLHEHGVPSAAAENGYLLAPDIEQAWVWYRRGADAGEPNALGRMAEREDGAGFADAEAEKSAAHRLAAFEYYAAACEQARIEDWPDEAWRNWRYRRASLARMLAKQNKMEQVASAYEEVLGQHAPRSQSLLNRLTELF